MRVHTRGHRGHTWHTGAVEIWVVNLDAVDLSDPAQLRAVADACEGNRRRRRDRAVVSVAEALRGLADRLDDLYLVEADFAEANRFKNDVGNILLDAMAVLIERADAIEAVRAQAVLLLLELVAASLRPRQAIPPEPRTQPPGQWARSHPALAQAPPAARRARRVAAVAA